MIRLAATSAAVLFVGGFVKDKVGGDDWKSWGAGIAAAAVTLLVARKVLG